LAAGKILGDLPDPIQELTDGLLRTLGYLTCLAGHLTDGPSYSSGRSSGGVPRCWLGSFGSLRGLFALLRLPGGLAHRILHPGFTGRLVKRFLDLCVGADHISDPCSCVAAWELLCQILQLSAIASKYALEPSKGVAVKVPGASHGLLFDPLPQVPVPFRHFLSSRATAIAASGFKARLRGFRTDSLFCPSVAQAPPRS
jgi:hypothetical protein